VMGRLRRQARSAMIEAKQLGQYTLDEKLGEGGMGVVYRAHHAMLHRPTAVKFLHPDKTTNETVARFEREVQLTSQLTHPNTIAVYDFGRTPEGVFYYAMEYLNGINLERLVYEHGPLPDGRVIYLLRQACGSLAEAHEAGLIHRDIKPANIVINARGGIYDLVKVLDFGLARAVDQHRQARVTSSGVLAGTPLYMSPEAIDHPDAIDARSDLYALGAVGYYLLTGTPVFDGSSIFEILDQHRNTPPEPPSQRLGKPVSTELSHLLLACLAKNPDDRPHSARELATALGKCSTILAWTEADAAAWWRTCRPTSAPPATVSSATAEQIDTTIDATVALRVP
jgi:eukaryotic-like serine/threonine-protein kinase